MTDLFCGTMDADHYCREIEAYLCRKNDGHLIRIVGPSFELVCGWADRGIPLKLVFLGIDRYFERYYARGPRRHPVRIDFCEADVLDAFDEWRRAIGRSLAAAGDTARDDPSDDAATRRRRQTLVAHVDAVVGRLIARRTSPAPAALDSEISRTIERLEALREVAAKSRGHARTRLLENLAELDRRLGAAARDSCPDDLKATLAEDAAEAVEPFRQRMPPGAYEQAVSSSLDRLLRQQLGLPTIAYE